MYISVPCIVCACAVVCGICPSYNSLVRYISFTNGHPDLSMLHESTVHTMHIVIAIGTSPCPHTYVHSH